MTSEWSISVAQLVGVPPAQALTKLSLYKTAHTTSLWPALGATLVAADVDDRVVALSLEVLQRWVRVIPKEHLRVVARGLAKQAQAPGRTADRALEVLMALNDTERSPCSGELLTLVEKGLLSKASAKKAIAALSVRPTAAVAKRLSAVVSEGTTTAEVVSRNAPLSPGALKPLFGPKRAVWSRGREVKATGPVTKCSFSVPSKRLALVGAKSTWLPPSLELELSGSKLQLSAVRIGTGRIEAVVHAVCGAQPVVRWRRVTRSAGEGALLMNAQLWEALRAKSPKDRVVAEEVASACHEARSTEDASAVLGTLRKQKVVFLTTFYGDLNVSIGLDAAGRASQLVFDDCIGW